MGVWRADMRMASDKKGVEQGHLGDTCTVSKDSDDEFAKADIRGLHEVLLDEPDWLPMDIGNDEYPAPVDHLVLGLVSCQLEVLDQAMRRARIEEYELEARGEVTKIGKRQVPEDMPGNTAAVIKEIEIDVSAEVPEEDAGRAEQCLEVYDQGCIVGQSLRAGIEYTPRTHLETY